jgi:hypothetical protein
MFSFSIKSQIQVDTVVSTYVTGSVRVDSSVVINDSVRVTDDVNISGSAKIAGDVVVGGSLLFSNGKGMSLTPFSSSNNTEIYSYGRSAQATSPSLNPCSNPNSPWQLHQFGGGFQIYDNGPTGYTGGNILSLQSWYNGSSIDVAGPGGLLMNYFCGKDIIMCTGGNGGIVFVGDKFQARKNVQIGQHYTAVDPNVTLNIYDITNNGIKLWPANQTVKLIHDNYDQFTLWGNGNAHLGNNVQVGYPANSAIQDANTSLNINNAGLNGIKFNTWNNAAGIFYINNVNAPFASYSPFVIYGDGNAQMGQAIQIGMTQSTLKTLAVNLNISSVNTQSAIVVNNGSLDVFRVLKNGTTYIGDKAPLASGPHGNAKLAVDGKILAKEIFVNVHNSVWPDYVFEKDYKILFNDELEKYISLNKHLPGLPSAKNIEENGLNLAEMLRVQMEKIEELYLIVLRQQKEIGDLKKENINSKK